MSDENKSKLGRRLFLSAVAAGLGGSEHCLRRNSRVPGTQFSTGYPGTRQEWRGDARLV